MRKKDRNEAAGRRFKALREVAGYFERQPLVDAIAAKTHEKALTVRERIRRLEAEGQVPDSLGELIGFLGLKGKDLEPARVWVIDGGEPPHAAQELCKTQADRAALEAAGADAPARILDAGPTLKKNHDRELMRQTLDMIERSIVEALESGKTPVERAPALDVVARVSLDLVRKAKKLSPAMLAVLCAKFYGLLGDPSSFSNLLQHGDDSASGRSTDATLSVRRHPARQRMDADRRRRERNSCASSSTDNGVVRLLAARTYRAAAVP